MIHDLYQTLGVSPHATQQEIRRAYIRLMKVNHPDARNDTVAASGAAEINYAFSVLKNPIERNRYDEQVSRSRANRSALLLLQSRAELSFGRGRARAWSFLLFVLLSAAAVVHVVLEEQRARGSVKANLKQQELDGTKLNQQDRSPAPVDIEGLSAAVASFAEAGATMGASRAQGRSRGCYVAAKTTSRYDLLDHCYAWDVVAGLWALEESDRTSQAFFNVVGRDQRYMEAANMISPDTLQNRLRRNEVERLTLTMMALYAGNVSEKSRLPD